MFTYILLTSCLFVISIENVTGVHFTDNSLITDVSGLAKFKGKYHLFYQYFNLQQNDTRDLSFFQKVSWGHSTSQDLIKWEILPKIIDPETDPEITIFRGKEVRNVSKVVPFSGSIIVDSTNVTGLLVESDEPVLLIYTALSKFLFTELDDSTNSDFILSSIHMFYSYDGIEFKKYERPMIEKSETLRNFRDPVVFKYAEGHYNLIMEENTKLGIHQSSDLINWKKVSTFEYELPEKVIEWETPNLIKLGNHSFLVLSVNLRPDNKDFHYSTTRYFVGQFDGYEYKTNNQSREFDGPDLYAISISEDHIMMGMLNNWKLVPFIKHNGTLTYPRRIGMMDFDGSTYLTQQFISLDAFSGLLFEGKDIVNEKLDYIFTINRPHYLKIKLINQNCALECDFELKFEDTQNIIRIGYTSSSNDFYLDRSESKKVNTYYNDVHKHKIKYKKILNTNEFEIDIILDVNSIEFLTDNGSVAISALHLNDKIFKNFTLTTMKKYKIHQFMVNYYV